MYAYIFDCMEQLICMRIFSDFNRKIITTCVDICELQILMNVLRAVCVFFHAYGKTWTLYSVHHECVSARDNVLLLLLLLFLFDPVRNVYYWATLRQRVCYYILGRDKADICGHMRRFLFSVESLHPLQINAVCIFVFIHLNAFLWVFKI